MSAKNQPTLSFLKQQLTPWFQAQGRNHLPWRQPGLTPYHVWVSEIMLQQTQVSRVIPYFERFVERFPTIEALATASWEEFLPYYQGLGYYRRGQNMLKAAKMVVDQYQGQFPRTKEELKKLPGVGEYTASAILSFGYGEQHLALDTNLQRVFGRYLQGDKKAALDIADIERKLGTDTDYQFLNAALMDFANIVCTNRSPKCLSCPLLPECMYGQTAGVLEESTQVQKSDFPTKEAQTVLVLHENHQRYFSAEAERYRPFILPAPLNTRARLKSYFQREYGLELSIRPPYLQAYVNGVPTLFTRAQILLGEHTFSSYDKETVQAWLNEVENDRIRD